MCVCAENRRLRRKLAAKLDLPNWAARWRLFFVFRNKTDMNRTRLHNNSMQFGVRISVLWCWARASAQTSILVCVLGRCIAFIINVDDYTFVYIVWIDVLSGLPERRCVCIKKKTQNGQLAAQWVKTNKTLHGLQMDIVKSKRLLVLEIHIFVQNFQMAMKTLPNHYIVECARFYLLNREQQQNWRMRIWMCGVIRRILTEYGQFN